MTPPRSEVIATLTDQGSETPMGPGPPRTPLKPEMARRKALRLQTSRGCRCQLWPAVGIRRNDGEAQQLPDAACGGGASRDPADWLSPTVAMADRGYDSRPDQEFLIGQGVIPIIPMRRKPPLTNSTRAFTPSKASRPGWGSPVGVRDFAPGIRPHVPLPG